MLNPLLRPDTWGFERFFICSPHHAANIPGRDVEQEDQYWFDDRVPFGLVVICHWPGYHRRGSKMSMAEDEETVIFKSAHHLIVGYDWVLLRMDL